PMAATPALPIAADAADAAPASAPGAAMPAAPAPGHGEPDVAVLDGPAPRDPAVSTEAASLADAERVRAAYRAGEGAAAGPQRAEAEVVRHGVAPAVPSAPTQGAELIHPQAATVVHQQLDLLATAVFRWSGQAWPEVPMDWSIQQEDERARDEAAAQDETRRWSTTVSLDLPRLGAVELRLTLAGDAVRAQFVASQGATAGRLRAHGAALEQRFEAAGLRLEGLRVSEKGGG
ncbi:flagellar hook-length control protein FliK, partial [Variovorax sp. WDL1]